MKIAMAFDGLGVGGIERVGIDYMKLLSEDGHDVTVYNLVPSANAMESEIEDSITIRHNSFPRKVCPEMYVSLVKRYSWGKYVYIPIDIATNIGLAFSKLIKKNRKETYDFAIAFSGHYNDLKFVASDFIKAKHKIWWLHGSILDYALLSSGFLMLYKKIGNLVSLSSFYDDGVMTSNKWLSDINIRKIYNPTFIADRELDECKIEHLRESYGEFLLMVGRFTKEKDQATVIRAGKILREQYGIQRNIMFLGDGPEREKIEMLAKEEGMDDLVIFAGNQMDVQNYYAASKILVHSSPAEGLPTVLLEAMNFGIPIVATNSLPGVPEILEGTKDGLVCDVGDAKGMADKIRLLLTNQELYEKYSNCGRNRIESFRPEYVRRQLESYFEEIIQRE